mmetsp:Transcript_39118/g.65724  ORF Transcript_39118/g.65724 Transcript_39118/m.65724 type:complete len:280 (-) Transcript_39118:156-995(-)
MMASDLSCVTLGSSPGILCSRSHKLQRASPRFKTALHSVRTARTCTSQAGRKDSHVRVPIRNRPIETRRSVVQLLSATLLAGTAPFSARAEFVDLPALRGKGYGKPVTIYSDYVQTDSGLQYKDLRMGAGAQPKNGDDVVIDWDAYTIGYYGRIVQAKNLAKGGSFEGSEEGYLRFKVGNGQVIQGIEEALEGMSVGGIRRLIIPAGALSYPEDTGFKKIGPVPNSFSGKRTLDFVMVNAGGIDKTLLMDIELLGIGKNAKARRAEGTWVEGVLAQSRS